MKRGQFDFPRVQNAQCNARGCMCVHVRVGFTPRERDATVRGQIAEGRLLPPDDRKSNRCARGGVDQWIIGPLPHIWSPPGFNTGSHSEVYRIMIVYYARGAWSPGGRRGAHHGRSDRVLLLPPGEQAPHA